MVISNQETSIELKTWDDYASIPMELGQHITAKNVKVEKYQEVINLATTDDSDLKVYQNIIFIH